MQERYDFTLCRRTADYKKAHAIEVSGNGDHTIVLGNGFGTDKSSWRELTPWLEARHRLVRFNWAVTPEHFDSVRYGSLDGYCDDLLAIVGGTTSKLCTLIGHSMSAMIGMLAAKRQPGFFRRIVMIAPAPCYVRHPDYAAGFSQENIDALLDQIGDDYMAWLMAFAPVAVGDPQQQDVIDDFRRSLSAMRPDIALTMARLIFSMDLREHLDGFITTTTIIQPTGDPVAPIAIGQYLAQRWPQARLEIIESAGHLPHLTAPRAVIEVLERALTEV